MISVKNPSKRKLTTMLKDIFKYLTIIIVYFLLTYLVDNNEIFIEDMLRISLYVTISLVVYYFLLDGFINDFLI